MIGKARVNELSSQAGDGASLHIDPKDYVLSEESIKALTELAMLVREIKIQQALDQADTANHHANKFTNRKTYPEGYA